MKKSILLAVLLFFALANTALAANTFIWGEDTIDISAIDADWTWNDAGTPYASHRDGILVHYIMFIPGAVSDKLVLLEENASGAPIFPPNPCPVAGQPQIIYFHGGKHLKMFLDESESTLSSGHRVMIGINR